MILTYFEPYRMIDRFYGEINRMFNVTPESSAAAASRWTPAFDVLEDEARYVLRADVPGVERKHLDINLKDSVLTIKGERTSEHADDKQGFRRCEHHHGQFFRQFALPDSVDTAGISARVSDGVLEISIPKQAIPGPRKIIMD
jgi:HSP20 family protein